MSCLDWLAARREGGWKHVSLESLTYAKRALQGHSSSVSSENMITDPEEALVRSARQGDRAAFEELVRRTSRLVFARLYLETGDVHRAEDLVQETFLLAFRSVKGLAEAGGFRTWLLKIAQNVAIDAARRDSRLKRTTLRLAESGSLDRVTDRAPQPEEQLSQEELRVHVLAVLRSLPEEYRLPLTLRYITGADYDTICTQLGLTNGSLRGLLHRGLKMLRTKLPADFGTGLGGE
jgi:RNA polymerase sigma-70 factor (ECF subfamily)